MRTGLWTSLLLASVGAAWGVWACGGSKCYLDCVYVPPECHVEGANSSTDCSKASCGTIVCPASDSGSESGADASFDVSPVSNDGTTSTDSAGDVGDSDSGQHSEAEAGPLDCTYDDGGLQFDGSSRFQGSCSGGCPAGTICAVEIGGVAGGGGEYCAPIPDRCKSNPTCACLASCACGQAFGRPQVCTDGTNQDGGASIACDNGIR